MLTTWTPSGTWMALSLMVKVRAPGWAEARSSTASSDALASASRSAERGPLRPTATRSGTSLVITRFCGMLMRVRGTSSLFSEIRSRRWPATPYHSPMEVSRASRNRPA